MTQMLSILAAALLAAQEASVIEKLPDSETAILAPAGVLLADCCVIKALTPVRLTMTAPISSVAAAPGQKFAFTLSEAIPLDDGRSIPAGTPGQGEVIQAFRSNMVGTGGELVLAARYLDFQGLRIPLRGLRFGSVGNNQGKTAKVVGTPAVAPLAEMVTLTALTGEVRLPAGTIAEARVFADTRIGRSRLAESSPTPVQSNNDMAARSK